MRPFRLLAPLVLVILAGCSSRGPLDTASSPRLDSDRLTSAELDANPQINLLETIKLLRPHWRGSVFVDGYPVGGMDELRRMTARYARTIEYLRPLEAAGRFGMALQGGGPVIAVVSR